MNKVREFAQKRNMKISELISKTGLAKSYVYDILKDTRNLSIKVAYTICNALDASMEEVFPNYEKDRMGTL